MRSKVLYWALKAYAGLGALLCLGSLAYLGYASVDQASNIDWPVFSATSIFFVLSFMALTSFVTGFPSLSGRTWLLFQAYLVVYWLTVAVNHLALIVPSAANVVLESGVDIRFVADVVTEVGSLLVALPLIYIVYRNAFRKAPDT